VSRLLDQFSHGMTYAEAGVSIEAGDEAVERIKSIVASTARREVLGGIGGFGGLFALDVTKFTSPVLVASADGVGTKLEVARQVGRYDTVGIDLVAMLVDDLACVGAEPLFLLDYVAVGLLDPIRLEELVGGIAEGCRQAKTALLGGETAEHGDVMKPDDLDVAGFVVGVIERGQELGPERVRVGDVSRILPDSLNAVIDMESFETPEIFFEIQRRGRVSADEMVRVFNCGLGMVIALDPSSAAAAVALARAEGLGASVVGDVTSGTGQVVVK
jgi:phosphoribosylaminoimidazole (AIR) synthetase